MLEKKRLRGTTRKDLERGIETERGKIDLDKIRERKMYRERSVGKGLYEGVGVRVTVDVI